MTLTLLLLATLATRAFASLPAGLAEAAAVGDCVRVQALVEPLLSGDQPDEVALLAAGRCAALEGDGERALHVLDRVAPDGPADPWARLLEAEALLAPQATDRPITADDAARALERIRGARLPPGLQARARLLEDRALIAAGRGLEARDHLRSLLETPDAAEARWWLAVAAEARGERAAARDTWLALWVRNPSSPFASRAEARLTALGRLPLDLRVAEDRKLAIGRAEALQDARLSAEALALLLDVERSLDPAAASTSAWTWKMADACFKGKDYACAAERYARLGSPDGAVPGGASSIFNHALAASRAGDYAGATAVYTALYRRYPNEEEGDFGSYKIGYLAYDQGRLEDAVRELSAHLDRFPRSSHRDEALWFIGWSQYRLGRVTEATHTWDRLVRDHPSSSLVPPAVYWLARAAEGGPDGQLYRDVMKRHPHSAGAWFVQARLQPGQVPLGTPAPPLPPIPAAFLAAHPDVALGDRFFEAGLNDWSLLLLEAGVPSARSADAATRLALARRLATLGRVTLARDLAGQPCRNLTSQADLREVCQPRPHAAVVEQVIGDTGLDPFLPYAIMLAESAMDPTVTSPAGARGLMQLMPEVARGLHGARYPDRPFHAEDLYLGVYNASLGTAELVRLWQRYRGRGLAQPLPVVIAAYNAGTEAVDRWLDAAGPSPDVDVLAENIGYTETRRYVRTVLGYVQQYHGVY